MKESKISTARQDDGKRPPPRDPEPAPNSDAKFPLETSIHPILRLQEPYWRRDRNWRRAPGDGRSRVPISGPPGLSKTRNGLNRVVDRHPILKSTFFLDERRRKRKEGAGPVQVTGQSLASLPLLVETIQSGDDSIHALNSLFERLSSGFRVSHGPLIGAGVVKESSGAEVLLLCAHPITADGISLEILFAEWAEEFGSDQLQTTAPTADAECSPRQPDEIADGTPNPQLAYWKDRFSGPFPAVELPTDRPRRVDPSSHSAALSRELGPDLAREARDFAAWDGVTLRDVVLAALHVFLMRYANTCDVLVGTRVDLRGPRGKNAIGPLENRVLLRTDLSGGTLSFRGVLARLRTTIEGAFAHQDIPFETVLEAAHPDLFFSGGFTPAIEFGWSDVPPAELRFGGTSGTPVAVRPSSELSFRIWDDGTTLQVEIQFKPELFDSATILDFYDHFALILARLIVAPDRPVCSISILSDAERDRVLVEWNDTNRSYPSEKTLPELFESQVERTPDAIALVFGENRLTYRELNARASRLARQLRNSGVGPDVLVGICAERSLELVVGLLGILKAGGAYVPFDPDFPPARLNFMMEDTHAPVVLTQRHLMDKLPVSGKIHLLDSDGGPAVPEDEINPPPSAGPDNLAYMIYTSGSTGRPKGAMIPHRGIVNRLHWMQEEYRLDSGDAVLQKTPFSFDVSVWEFFWPLLTGARLVLAEPGKHGDARYLAGLIETEKITTLHFVPSMLNLFLDSAPLEKCRSVQRAIASGEALSPDLAERFHARWGCELHNLYGPTEASVDVTSHQCRKDEERIPIGRPIANTQIYILDDRGAPVPIGVAGELHIGGIGLARGYWNRPELTAEKFIPNPFDSTGSSRLYRTGDLARFLRTGEIEYLGRIDHQVKIRGFRIELGEIEAALAAHPGIAESVVTAWDDPVRGKRLIAYLLAASGPKPDPGNLRTFLGETLAEYMIPSAFVWLDSLPRTPSGKIDRRALPAPSSDRPELRKEYIAPRDPTEVKLVGIWEKVLGMRPIGVADDYFELGADSLITARAFAQIEKEFGQRIPPTVLFRAPTAEKLAALLKAGADLRERSCLVPIRAEGVKPPLFCIHGGAGTILFFYNMAKHLADDRPVYALQARGLYGDAPPDTQVSQMADRYLAEIRSVQKTGPYYLAGYCFGGIVAFEIAQRLRRENEEVAFLASLNGPSPRYINGPGKGGFIGSKRPLTRLKEFARSLWFKSIRWRASRAIAHNQPLPESLREPYFMIGTYRAERMYQPETYPGRMVLFYARGLYYDPLQGWDRLVTGGIDFHEIPGDHDSHKTIMREPMVGDLAREIRRELDKLSQPEIGYAESSLSSRPTAP